MARAPARAERVVLRARRQHDGVVAIRHHRRALRRRRRGHQLAVDHPHDVRRPAAIVERRDVLAVTERRRAAGAVGAAIAGRQRWRRRCGWRVASGAGEAYEHAGGGERVVARLLRRRGVGAQIVEPLLPPGEGASRHAHRLVHRLVGVADALGARGAQQDGVHRLDGGVGLRVAHGGDEPKDGGRRVVDEVVGLAGKAEVQLHRRLRGGEQLQPLGERSFWAVEGAARGAAPKAARLEGAAAGVGGRGAPPRREAEAEPRARRAQRTSGRRAARVGGWC